MDTKVTLAVETCLRTFTLDVHPQMAATEATQLICACSLFHRDHSVPADATQPACIIGASSDLLLSYLMTSTETTVG